MEHSSWLFQSRLAAEKEYEALKLLHARGVAVSEPISQNRHVIVMGLIEGAELSKWKEIPSPKRVLREILLNIRKAYLKTGIIHADLSEYNIILKPDRHVLIIDWPQYVTKEHPNAQELLNRDVRNILNYFNRRSMLKANVEEALGYVTGTNKITVE